MPALSRDRRVRLAAQLSLGVVLVVVLTPVVGFLRSPVGVPDPSTVYIVAVVVMAVGAGIGPAIATAVASIVSYDLLFIEPRFTLDVADPGELLDLLMLLLVGIVVGQLAGLQRRRADAAEVREREARALFAINRAVATGATTDAATPQLLAAVCREAELERAWIVLDDDGPSRRVLADTGGGQVPSVPAAHHVLQRTPGDRPAIWVRVHEPRRARAGARTADDQTAYRVRIAVADRTYGSLWGVRRGDRTLPSRSATRVIAAAADRIGSALERDRLAGLATDAEVARRSDDLKSSLLDSVSHDLRTPLATIRAAGGTLADPDAPLDPDRVRVLGGAIDREAQRLDRLVSNLLDLSRIGGDGLRPTIAPHILADVVDTALARTRDALAPRSVAVDIPEDLPPVLVDEVLMDQVLANLLENIAAHTPITTGVSIEADTEDDQVVLRVEDDGPGVPPEARARLFDRFYRVPSTTGRARGTGIGLTVALGLVDAMHGSIAAEASASGGLAVVVRLPAAPPPPGAGPPEDS